jgi:CheY-like chemotaxis protein
MSLHQPKSGGSSTRVIEEPFHRGVVLAVDDDRQVLKLTRAILERTGYRVMAASDGPEALAFSRSYAGEIHLLLSDVEMPGVGGVELARLVIAERPGTRVLMQSANPAYRQLTEFPFLAKPFTADALKQAVALAAGPHIDKAMLESYAMDAAPAEAVASIEEHLLVCERCRQELSAGDDYIAAIRAAARLDKSRV